MNREQPHDPVAQAPVQEWTADKALVERLAAVEHDRWADWQRYMHGKAERRSDGSLILPAELVERWETQISTSYASLSEAEKESDREEVRRYLPLIANALTARIAHLEAGLRRIEEGGPQTWAGFYARETLDGPEVVK